MSKQLTGQMKRVHAVLSDGHWHTLSAIQKVTGDATPSISARIRDLRKEQYGRFVVEKRSISKGVYEYRLFYPLVNGSPVGSNFQLPEDPYNIALEPTRSATKKRWWQFWK